MSIKCVCTQANEHSMHVYGVPTRDIWFASFCCRNSQTQSTYSRVYWVIICSQYMWYSAALSFIIFWLPMSRSLLLYYAHPFRACSPHFDAPLNLIIFSCVRSDLLIAAVAATAAVLVLNESTLFAPLHFSYDADYQHFSNLMCTWNMYTFNPFK